MQCCSHDIQLLIYHSVQYPTQVYVITIFVHVVGFLS